MAPHVVQVNFDFSCPYAELYENLKPTTQMFANVPGLVWKVWMHNDEEGRFGGIYLFDGEQSMRAFLEGPIPGQVASLPHVSNLQARTFEVAEDLSLATRAQLYAAQPA